jgi:hypothetical protein
VADVGPHCAQPRNRAMIRAVATGDVQDPKDPHPRFLPQGEREERGPHLQRRPITLTPIDVEARETRCAGPTELDKDP